MDGSYPLSPTSTPLHDSHNCTKPEKQKGEEGGNCTHNRKSGHGFESASKWRLFFFPSPPCLLFHPRNAALSQDALGARDAFSPSLSSVCYLIFFPPLPEPQSAIETLHLSVLYVSSFFPFNAPTHFF